MVIKTAKNLNTPYDLTVYDTAWYEFLERFDEWNVRALFAAIAHTGMPSSYLDVGCGNGYLVRLMSSLLIGPSFGLEITEQPGCLPVDLRNQYDFLRVFDLVTCWEVGEHLPPESADTFCDNVARHVGKWLVFTAAHKDQGGQYHLNEQSPEYWRKKLEARGLKFEQEITGALKKTWVVVTGPCHWLPENVQVFSKVPV